MAFNLSALTAQQQAAAIYIGYYDRAPDPYGMDFWEAAVANPVVPLVDIATYFAAQEETYAVHPFFVEPSADAANAFISELYLNLFNREPDAAGLTFWSGVLQGSIAGTNEFSVGEIILEIIQGAQNTAAGQDITTLLNKIEVANAWTAGAIAAGLTEPNSYGDSEIAQNSAKSIIEDVTSASSSVVAAKAVIATAFDGLYDGITVDLTPGADNIELTRGSDTVTGVIKELSIGDRIIDPSTTDADVMNVEMIEDIASNVTVQNIETVVLNALSGEREIRVTNWDGIQTYQVIGEGDVILTDVQTTEPEYEFKGTAGTNITVSINDLATTALADEISVVLSDGVAGGTFTLTPETTVETIRVISNGDDENVLTNVVGTNVRTLIIEGDAAFENTTAFAATIDAIDARGVSQADIHTAGALTVLTGAGDDLVTTNAALTNDTAIVMGAGTDNLVLNDSTGGAEAELLGIEFIKTTDAGATDIDMVKSTSTPEFNIAGGSTGITLSNLRDGSSVRTSEDATSGDINIGYRTAASNASIVVDLVTSHDGDGDTLTFTNVANVTLNVANGLRDVSGVGVDPDVELDDTSLAAGVVSDVVKSLTINNNGVATNGTDDIVLGDVSNSSRLETLTLNATGSAVTLGDIDEAEGLTTLTINAAGGEVAVGDIGNTNASTALSAITVTATEDVTLGAVAVNNTAGVSSVTLAAADGDIGGLDLTNDAGSIDAVTLSGAGDIEATFTTVLTGSGTAGYTKSVTSTNTGTVTLDITNAKTSGSGTVISLADGASSITLDSAMDDTITTGSKSDTLILDGAIGSDTINLGGGTDTLSFANNTTGIVINIGSTDAYLNGKDGNSASAAETVAAATLYDSAGSTSGDQSSIAGVERVIGGSGADNIFGSTASDTLDGGAGNDVVNGGAGADNLSGGAGNDTVNGGAGDDAINGGAGTDVLTGGDGADTFTIASADGDEITDFVAGTDVLNIDVGTGTGALFAAAAAGASSLNVIQAYGKTTAAGDEYGVVAGALSSANIFGTYANVTDFFLALAGTKSATVKGTAKVGSSAAVKILTFVATVNDVSNSIRADAVASGSHVVFGLGANGEVWAANITAGMLTAKTGVVSLKVAGNTGAASALDVKDISLVAVADGITAADIVIV